MPGKMPNYIMLMTATLIWGTALVAQDMGMAYIGPFLFNGARFFIGAVVLLPVFAVGIRKDRGKGGIKGIPLKEGALCGIVLFLAASFQQIGILNTTVGKAGFITALYIVIVPVLSLFLGKRIRWYVWGCVLLAAAGVFLLCMDETLILGLGDSLVMLCAFSTAVHILLIGRFSPSTDGIALSFIQFCVCAILSTSAAFAFEDVGWNAIISARGPILYTGVLSCGVAYTLQTLGQKNVSPVIAALILSMESVFSALSGWAVLGEVLSVREMFGCTLMFIAIIMVQLPEALGSPSSPAVRARGADKVKKMHTHAGW